MRPNKKDLAEAAAQLWRQNEKQHAIDKEIDDLLWNRHTISLPEGIEPVERKSGKAYDIISRLDGLMMSEKPIPEVEVGTMGRRDTERGNKIEDFLNGFAEESKRGQDPWTRTGLDVLSMGRGISAVYGALQYWRDYPEPKDDQSAEDYNDEVDAFIMKARHTPIAWRHIPAMEFIPVFGDLGELREGYWFTTKNAQEVAERYNIPGLRKQYGGKIKSTDKCRWVEWANDEYLAYGVSPSPSWPDDKVDYLTDIEFVKVFKHMTPGYVPYVFIGGMESGSAIKELQFYSVLYPLKEIIKALDEERSQFATAHRSLGLFTALVQKFSPVQRPKGEAGIPPNIEFGPLAKISVWSDEDIFWLAHPGLNQDYDKEIARLERDADRLGFAALENLAPDATGVARVVTIATAKKRFDRILEKMSLGYQQIGERVLEVVKNIPNGEKVSVYRYGENEKGFVSLAARDLVQPYRLHVDIPSPISPDLAAVTNVALSLRQGDNPLYPDTMILKTLYHEQAPERVIDAVRIQQIMRSPEWTQKLARDALRDADLLLAREEAQGIMQDIQAQQMYNIPPALAAALGGGAQELVDGGQQQTAVPPEVAAQPGTGAPLVPGPLSGQLQAEPSGPRPPGF